MNRPAREADFRRYYAEKFAAEAMNVTGRSQRRAGLRADQRPLCGRPLREKYFTLIGSDIKGGMMLCHGCGRAVQVADKVYRDDLCPGCGRALHCCMNCTFYDVNAHNQCREPQAEWVGDKQAANFCDYFRTAEIGKISPGRGGNQEARKKLEDLFRKKPE